MKTGKTFSAIMALIMLVLGGCSAPSENADIYESWQEEIRIKTNSEITSTLKNTGTKTRTWYEIFVYSFNDTNGDGIGDLNGITEMLDYIEYMGFSGIWLTPVHSSPTYHKYDVIDYFSIDPVYGTIEDFERLVSECNKRGIALIMDMVINHTSSKHEWFVKALEELKSGDSNRKYADFYNFAEEPGNGQWKNVLDGWYYECQFWSEMPDLNLESEAVRAELNAVFSYWLNKGVSGFRLDAAKEYVSGNTEKNIEILSWVNSTVKAIKEDAYLVGEVWETGTGFYDYYRSGIDSFFNFNFAAADGKIAKTLTLKNQTAESYAEALLSAQELIIANNPDSIDAPFFTNHDTARAGGFLRRDANLIKTAWGMNLTQSGNAFVYYGEEIGMSGSGKDENKRAPMFWTSDENAAGITKGPPAMEAVKYDFDSVPNQIGDETSILEYIRKAVMLRNKYPEVTEGIITAVESPPNDKVCAIVKKHNDNSVILYYNLSDKTVNINSESDLKDISVCAPKDWLSATGEEPAFNNGELSLPPYSIVIAINCP